LDKELVFVNQTLAHDGRCKLGPADRQRFTGLLLQASDFFDGVPLTSLEFPSTLSRVCENTIFSIFFQIWRTQSRTSD